VKLGFRYNLRAGSIIGSSDTKPGAYDVSQNKPQDILHVCQVHGDPVATLLKVVHNRGLARTGFTFQQPSATERACTRSEDPIKGSANAPVHAP
jgi:hypothetical protein